MMTRDELMAELSETKSMEERDVILAKYISEESNAVREDMLRETEKRDKIAERLARFSDIGPNPDMLEAMRNNTEGIKQISADVKKMLANAERAIARLRTMAQPD